MISIFTRRLLFALMTSCSIAAPSVAEPLAAAESPSDGATEARAPLRDELRQLVGHARDQVFPALVSIRAVALYYQGGKEVKNQVVGSGTVISADGLVVSNEHVTRDGTRFVCTLSDKRQVSAVLVGEDPLTDLSLLRLDMSELEGGPPLAVAHFGDSSALEIGDVVLAMGSPLALSRSVSMGIVSNTERVFAAGFGSDDIEELELSSGQRTGLFTRWIQHDAVISPGNSGGPLVNLSGEIVGVNELGGSTLSFAIPSDLAARVTRELAEHGEVERSSMGLSFKAIERLGLDRGVLISSVEVDGPAAEAGVRAGDVLVALDGEPLTVRFIEEVPILLDRLASFEVGSRHSLTLERDGGERAVEVVTKKLEKDLGDQASFRAWGFTARDVTPKMALDRGLPSTRGVLVTGVRPSGPAQQAEPQMARGDILLSIDGRTIEQLADLIAYYQDVDKPGAEPSPLLVELDRRGRNYVTLLEPGESPTSDAPRELPKAWIGVATQVLLPTLAEQLELGDQRGFRITRVYPGTLAADAGLQVGDVIVAVGEQPMAPNSLQDQALFERQVRSLAIGDTTSIRVLRAGELLDLQVELERTRLTPREARRQRDTDFELGVRELTFFDRDERRWEDETRGVFIESVEPGGWAELGGLRRGDLLQRLGDHEIVGLRSFRAAMEAVKAERPERLVAVVLRANRTYFQFLEPDWAPRLSDAVSADAASSNAQDLDTQELGE